MNEELIKKYMESLDLTREEAIQLIEDDKADEIGEEGEVLQKKAGSSVHRETSSEKKVRKPRVKKVDAEKADIVARIAELLADYSPVITNIDGQIDLNNITIKVIRHKAK